MTTVTEGIHTGEFILSEANGTLSREEVTIASGADLTAGTVLGKITKGTTGTAAADAGNTGNGTCSAVVLSAGYKLGVYQIVFIEPGSDAGKFTVEAPDGKTVGTGTVGTEFDKGGLTFTISDGATDFVAGDSFTITVAEGSGKYAAHDEDATNGTEDAIAVLYADANAASADVSAVIIARNAEVDDNSLTWPAGIDAGDKADGIASLATVGIIVR